MVVHRGRWGQIIFGHQQGGSRAVGHPSLGDAPSKNALIAPTGRVNHALPQLVSTPSIPPSLSLAGELTQCGSRVVAGMLLWVSACGPAGLRFH